MQNIPSSSDEVAGEADVRIAGCGFSAGMIVHADDRSRIGNDGSAEDLSRMNEQGIDGSHR